MSRPADGLFHPASKDDVERVLRYFGEVCTYGLQSIHLVQGVPTPAGDRLLLGTLRAPGSVRLYAQLLSPWALPGSLAPETHAWLRRAGAKIERAGQGLQTVVSWPGDTLREFMLLDVLMHEIGHHLVQHHTGKRIARVARTRDHEAFARLFAGRCRRLWTSRDSPRWLTSRPDTGSRDLPDPPDCL